MLTNSIYTIQTRLRLPPPATIAPNTTVRFVLDWYASYTDIIFYHAIKHTHISSNKKHIHTPFDKNQGEIFFFAIFHIRFTCPSFHFTAFEIRIQFNASSIASSIWMKSLLQRSLNYICAEHRKLNCDATFQFRPWRLFASASVLHAVYDGDGSLMEIAVFTMLLKWFEMRWQPNGMLIICVLFN